MQILLIFNLSHVPWTVFLIPSIYLYIYPTFHTILGRNWVPCNHSVYTEDYSIQFLFLYRASMVFKINPYAEI